MTYEAIYREARKTATPSESAALVMRAGCEFARAADLSWIIETGKPTPAWARGDGSTHSRPGEMTQRQWEKGMEPSAE